MTIDTKRCYQHMALTMNYKQNSVKWDRTTHDWQKTLTTNDHYQDQGLKWKRKGKLAPPPQKKLSPSTSELSRSPLAADWKLQKSDHAAYYWKVWLCHNVSALLYFTGPQPYNLGSKRLFVCNRNGMKIPQNAQLQGQNSKIFLGHLSPDCTPLTASGCPMASN